MREEWDCWIISNSIYSFFEDPPCCFPLWLHQFTFTNSVRGELEYWVFHETVQFIAQSCPTLCPTRTAARQTSLSISNSWSLPKLMSIELVMPSNHLILCRPLLLSPSIFSSIRVFSNESVHCIRWPKYWSFSFSVNLSNEYSGLISFRMDWLDLLTVQGTLKSLLQHHSSKTSIIQCSAFFIVQPSHPYLTTGKTIALTRQTFVGKVTSLFLICYLGWS